MKLHDRLSVSEKKLKELKGLEKDELNSWIASHSIFHDLTKKKRAELIKDIYGKISPKPVKGRTSKSKKTSSKRNRKDSIEEQRTEEGKD